MSPLSAIVIATQFGVLGAPPEWSMWLREESGWGRSGIYIDSTGRNVSMDSLTTPELHVSFMEGIPAAMCNETPLSAYQVRKFAFRIASIPQDVLEGGPLSIAGACNDALELHILLKMNDRVHEFGYADIPSCRDGREVPSWLSSLVRAMQERKRQIDDCAATQETAQ